MSAPLLSLAEDTALLALEAQTVIGIRLTQLSLGGSAAGAEAQRMVTEKVAAFAEAAALLASGGSAHEVVKGYRAGQAPDGVAVVNGSVNVLVDALPLSGRLQSRSRPNQSAAEASEPVPRNARVASQRESVRTTPYGSAETQTRGD